MFRIRGIEQALVVKCGDLITKHHVIYKCETANGKGGLVVPMCQAHQTFVHSKDTWGDEDFAYLRESKI